MKVLLATEIYPPRAGGAGWSIRALGLALREAGHEVTVLTTSPGPGDLDGLEVRRRRADGEPLDLSGHPLCTESDIAVHSLATDLPVISAGGWIYVHHDDAIFRIDSSTEVEERFADRARIVDAHGDAVLLVDDRGIVYRYV